MVLRRAVGITLAAIALAGATREASAQPFTVTENGQPVAGAEISAMINGIKTPLGTTDSTGQITIDPDDLNITKGTEVQVHWIKSCEDGTVQVILVPPGQQSECAAQDAQAGERCGCRRHPVPIIWGNGPVTIDVGTGKVTQTSMGGGAGASSYAIGVGVDILQMLELQNVLEEIDTGATDHDATGWAPGFQLFGEWRYRKLFAIGIEGGYSRMDTEIRFPQGLQTGELDYYRLGLNAKVGPPTTGRFWPYGTVGWYRSWNKGDFELDGLSDHRVHKTSLVGLGAGFDWDAGASWAVRFEGLYSSTFDDLDADEHIRWKGALLWRLGQRVTYAYDRGGLHE